MKILDANYILRYLLEDIPDMYVKARLSIEKGDCAVCPEVIAEVVYVLKSVYKVERSEIAKAIICLLDEVDCDKKEALLTCLALYSSSSLDFVDCLLIAYNKCYEYEILTFDKKMLKRLS